MGTMVEKCVACLDDPQMTGHVICEGCARCIGLIPAEPLPGEEKCPVTLRYDEVDEDDDRISRPEDMRDVYDELAIDERQDDPELFV
jgi:epoxyqueuosine reductase QueG